MVCFTQVLLFSLPGCVWPLSLLCCGFYSVNTMSHLIQHKLSQMCFKNNDYNVPSCSWVISGLPMLSLCLFIAPCEINDTHIKPVWMSPLLQWDQLELGLGLGRQQHLGRVWDSSPWVCASDGALQQPSLQRKGSTIHVKRLKVASHWAETCWCTTFVRGSPNCTGKVVKVLSFPFVSLIGA